MHFKKSTYKWFYDHIHSRYYDLLIKFCYFPFGGERKCREKFFKGIEFNKNEKILDLCCGTGGITFLIAMKAEKDSEIIGLDLSTGQLSKANRKNKFNNVLFIERNAAQTKFTDEFFDKVFIAFALHEMERDERLTVLKEAKRILQNSGKLIIFEIDEPVSRIRKIFNFFWFFYWFPLNPETPTRKDLQKHKLINEVKKSGFDVVSKSNFYNGTFQSVVAAKHLKKKNNF